VETALKQQEAAHATALAALQAQVASLQGREGGRERGREDLQGREGEREGGREGGKKDIHCEIISSPEHHHHLSKKQPLLKPRPARREGRRVGRRKGRRWRCERSWRRSRVMWKGFVCGWGRKSGLSVSCSRTRRNLRRRYVHMWTLSLPPSFLPSYRSSFSPSLPRSLPLLRSRS